jgi:pyrophosphatase PpaX
MAFDAYLFDLDGTLIDSTELILESFHHARQVHFGDRLSDDYYAATFGMPLRDAFSAMTPEAKLAQAMFETYLAFNLERHDSMIQAFPDVRRVIKELADRGARLALVTGKIHEHAVRGLRVTGLANEIRVVIGADDVTFGKPHPESVERALSALEAFPERTLFVGDSPHDVEAGQRAGVATAAALWGPFPRSAFSGLEPTYWLTAPSDLLRL